MSQAHNYPNQRMNVSTVVIKFTQTLAPDPRDIIQKLTVPQSDRRERCQTLIFIPKKKKNILKLTDF